MLKLIKKYQQGGTESSNFVPNLGLPNPSLASQTIDFTNKDWLKKLNTPTLGMFQYNLNKPTGTSNLINNTINKKLNFSPLGPGSGLDLSGKSLSGSYVTGNTPIKSKNTSFMDGIGGDIVSNAGDALGAGLNLSGVKQSTIGSGANGIFTGVGNFLGNFGTVGKIAGGVVKVFGAINQYAGKGLAKQQTADSMLDTGGYTKLLNVNAGGKTSLLTMGRAKGIDAQTKFDDQQNLKAANAQYGVKQNQIASANAYGDTATRNQQQVAGGLKTNVLSVKKGSKLELSNIVSKAKKNVKKAQEGGLASDTQTMQDGGETPNVIPEGALHARKNHYEGELGDQVTHKGIPVITKDDDGKITQHAEIEHSEIIFNKQFSTQLEDWFNKYKDLEDAEEKKNLEIECGKSVTHQILNNTHDNVDLINRT